jgi:hypothetical protein
MWLPDTRQQIEAEAMSLRNGVEPMDFSAWQTFVAIAGAFATAIATYVNLKLKGDMSTLKGDVDKAIILGIQSLENKLSQRIDQSNSLNTSIESRIMSKMDEMRKEVMSSFVPSSLAQEQRSSLERRVSENTTEIGKNRDTGHTLSNKFTEYLLGPHQKVTEMLTDKARRMSAFEERLRNMETDVRQTEKRLESLEQTRH